MRDEFSAADIVALAKRVGYHCSNPNCDSQTSGPHLQDNRSVNIGVAAHIAAASPGGPRFDASLSQEERSHIANGIWLCQSCGKLVDSDTSRFTPEVLRRWKASAELKSLQALRGGSTREYYPVSPGRTHTPIPKIHDLDYETARAALIGAGWQPAMHHWREGEKFTFGSGKYLWEKGYREIIDASGTGLAHMWFRFRDVHGNELIVMTSGESVDENGGAKVWRWYFDPEQSTTPELAASTTTSQRFQGQVGQLGQSRAFIDFIYDNVGNVVWLDIFVAERDFRGNYGDGGQWFVLYDKVYRELAEGEDFDFGNATGVQFSFKERPDSKDCAFYWMRTFVKLRGHFAILGSDGPHQGLMGVMLKPLNVEDAPRQTLA